MMRLSVELPVAAATSARAVLLEELNDMNLEEIRLLLGAPQPSPGCRGVAHAMSFRFTA
jgi:hypothetical protein